MFVLHYPNLAPIYLGPGGRYLDVFLSFEDPVLSSLIKNGPKWGPNCADDVPVRGAHARARVLRTGTSAAQLGPHFGLIGTRRGQNPKESHQR